MLKNLDIWFMPRSRVVARGGVRRPRRQAAQAARAARRQQHRKTKALLLAPRALNF